MKTIQSALRLVPITLILALTACSTAWNPPLHEKTTKLTVPHVPDSAITVESKNGALSVKASDREDVEIVAVLRMRTLERLEATTIETSRNDVNRLTVQVVWPGDGRLKNEGCSFTIVVPDAKGVELRSANGRVRIAGLSGTANLRTSNGGIEVESHQGDVTAQTSNGGIIVHGTDGSIDVGSSNGRVEIVDATESVKAHTSNGSVNIRYTETGTGPVDARSSNGSITLTMGPGFKGELEADNSNGGLNVGELHGAQTLSTGKHHVHLQFDESKIQSKVRTSNGSISIRER